MKEIFFVRHGESNSNKSGISLGEASILTERGEEEARIVSERIARLNVEALISSTYPRAIATAAPTAEALGLEIEQSPLFIEWRRPSHHIGRNRGDADIRVELDQLFAGFGMEGQSLSDEETFAEMRDRALAALAFLQEHEAQRIAVVTHGIFLRMILGVLLFGERLTGEEFASFWRVLAGNTGITHIRYVSDALAHERGWQLVSWNDSAHLG